MKKILILLFTVIWAISFIFMGVGCKAPAEEEVTPAEEEVTPAEEEVVEEEAVVEEEVAEPIQVGHLSYHTGPFGHVGPQFDGATNFPIDLINENPPLGRTVTAIHQDIGTIGEPAAARKLVQNQKVEVLLNPAHEYMAYRDWILEYIKDHGTPMMPSVHGGAIDRQYGGTPEEPMFRGSPMDSTQGVATAIQAQEAGAKSVVIMASETAGMQMQREAAAKAAEELGMTVLLQIDFMPEQTSYRSEVSKAQDKNPDALLVFGAAEDGGVIVKNAAELGMSLIIIGATDWLFEEFPKIATMSAINQHKAVWAVGFTYADTPAWDFYEREWNNSVYSGLSDAANSYTMQYYDLLNVTMLAIQAAGTTEAGKWAEYVEVVAEGPGKKVYTYQEGIEALKNGEEIDYSGVTGEMNYTDTGVVGGSYGVYEWENTTTMNRVNVLEGQPIVDLDSKIFED